MPAARGDDTGVVGGTDRGRYDGRGHDGLRRAGDRVGDLRRTPRGTPNPQAGDGIGDERLAALRPVSSRRRRTGGYAGGRS